MTINKRIAAGVAAVAVALGAAGIAYVVTPANADQNRPQAKGSTVVTFTEGAVDALGPLSPTAARPGAFGLSPSGLAVEGAFPIVGNAKGGVIDHVGGLTLTDGTDILTLRNYKIDTNAGVLTANGFVNGASSAGSTSSRLQLTPAQPGCDASADLTLAPAAAGALTALFDAPDLTGAAIGTACVDLR